MNCYEATIYVNSRTAKLINKALTVPDILDEDDTITNTAHFPNGIEMDVKCCGASEGCLAWTEAVLFNSNGMEISWTSPETTYFGEWTLEDGEDLYTVYVVEANVPIIKTTKGEKMLTLADLKTGMRVRTKEKGDYYVILDWTHQRGDRVQCTGLLIKTSDNHETPWLFHGLLGYNPDLTFSDNHDWDIEHVFVYTGAALDDMEDDEAQSDWVEITEPVHYDQTMLAKYFAKFD